MRYILNMDRYDYKEVKSLGLALTFTNSELMSFTCKRKYAYNYVDCIEKDFFSQAMFYGTSWHYFCELFLLQVKDNDKIPNKEVIEEIIEIEVANFVRTELDKFSQVDKEEVFEIVLKNIRLGSIGWIKKWKEEVHTKYKVLDVEKVVVKPIITKDGKILTCEMPIIHEHFEDCQLARLPLVGEIKNGLDKNTNIILGDKETYNRIGSSVENKELSVFKVGKIDCVLLDRSSNTIWVLDHKTSKSTLSYANKMAFDLQLQSYSALLQWNIENGMYSEYKRDGEDLVIGGVIWDIVSSKFNSPSYNTDGSLKKVRRGYITHALALEILSSPIYENSKDEYEDYLQVLEDRDNSNYFLIEEFITGTDIDRSNAEDLVRTKQAIQFKKECYSLDTADTIDTDMLLVRQPICQLYNFCEHSNICMPNIGFKDPTMLIYNRSHKVYWKVV